MKRTTTLRAALAILGVLPFLALGCSGNQTDTAKNEAGAKTAMEQGAAPQSDKGQGLQAPPAPPP
jgi:hypothetical protein